MSIWWLAISLLFCFAGAVLHFLAHYHHHWMRTISSDLEVLTLIPAISESASNCPRACWRSLSDEANRTTSSAKSREAILRFPKRTLSSPQLLLILSVSITNRFGKEGNLDRGQHSLKTFNFVPKIWHSSHWMACSNGPSTPYSCSTSNRVYQGTWLL